MTTIISSMLGKFCVLLVGGACYVRHLSWNHLYVNDSVFSKTKYWILSFKRQKLIFKFEEMVASSRSSALPSWSHQQIGSGTLPLSGLLADFQLWSSASLCQKSSICARPLYLYMWSCQCERISIPERAPRIMSDSWWMTPPNPPPWGQDNFEVNVPWSFAAPPQHQGAAGVLFLVFFHPFLV